jgi:hypothetical protein
MPDRLDCQPQTSRAPRAILYVFLEIRSRHVVAMKLLNQALSDPHDPHATRVTLRKPPAESSKNLEGPGEGREGRVRESLTSGTVINAGDLREIVIDLVGAGQGFPVDGSSRRRPLFSSEAT